MRIEADRLRWLDHVELLNLNICLEVESSLGGSLKRWEERKGNSEGGKERESKGWGGIVGGLDGSKPQNCDVILLRVERLGCCVAWDIGLLAKAGWAGQPWRP